MSYRARTNTYGANRDHVRRTNDPFFLLRTLQQDEVQLSSFGRLLERREDTMSGYRQSLIEITDRT